MSLKVASSNEKVIDMHFGQAPNFLIFEIKENGDSEFIEERKNISPSDDSNLLENHDATFAKSVNLISNCDVVLASQIDPFASKGPLSYEVQAYSILGFMTEKALKKLASSKLVSKPISRPIIY